MELDGTKHFDLLVSVLRFPLAALWRRESRATMEQGNQLGAVNLRVHRAC